MNWSWKHRGFLYSLTVGTYVMGPHSSVSHNSRLSRTSVSHNLGLPTTSVDKKTQAEGSVLKKKNERQGESRTTVGACVMGLHSSVSHNCKHTRISVDKRTQLEVSSCPISLLCLALIQCVISPKQGMQPATLVTQVIF
ncbi:hypothetical protein RHMOL_Rhmol01G0021200 [Rhododendron molle]|uniref:Uncharacterized protein n=1 Tax=Rhododendron molle TaxID=49168 RepID=A0ACC0PYP4_RHOML|nr:hypothetical protein RHMOL_Rhmol01G0021200 [Rhododendron molle]